MNILKQKLLKGDEIFVYVDAMYMLIYVPAI